MSDHVNTEVIIPDAVHVSFTQSHTHSKLRADVKKHNKYCA